VARRVSGLVWHEGKGEGVDNALESSSSIKNLGVSMDTGQAIPPYGGCSSSQEHGATSMLLDLWAR
jgi:hypothetical protein